MCKAIPVVENWHHTYRTEEESKIKYKFVLANEIEKEIPYEEYVKENTKIFETSHMIN